MRHGPCQRRVGRRDTTGETLRHRQPEGSVQQARREGVHGPVEARVAAKMRATGGQRVQGVLQVADGLLAGREAQRRIDGTGGRADEPGEKCACLGGEPLAAQAFGRAPHRAGVIGIESQKAGVEQRAGRPAGRVGAGKAGRPIGEGVVQGAMTRRGRRQGARGLHRIEPVDPGAVRLDVDEGVEGLRRKGRRPPPADAAGALQPVEAVGCSPLGQADGQPMPVGARGRHGAAAERGVAVEDRIEDERGVEGQQGGEAQFAEMREAANPIGCRQVVPHGGVGFEVEHFVEQRQQGVRKVGRLQQSSDRGGRVPFGIPPRGVGESVELAAAVRIARREAVRVLVGGEGLGDAPLQLQHVAELEMRVGHVGLLRQRLPVGPLGTAEIALLLERMPTLHMQGPASGIDREGRRVARLGDGPVAVRHRAVGLA